MSSTSVPPCCTTRSWFAGMRLSLSRGAAGFSTRGAKRTPCVINWTNGWWREGGWGSSAGAAAPVVEDPDHVLQPHRGKLEGAEVPRAEPVEHLRLDERERTRRGRLELRAARVQIKQLDVSRVRLVSLGLSITGLRKARGPGLGSSAGRRCGPQSSHKLPAPGCASVRGRTLAARRAPAPAGLTRAVRQRASCAHGDVVTLPCRACRATRRRGAWGGAAGTGSARCSAAEMPSRAQSLARSCSAATRRASAAAAGSGAPRASPSLLSAQNAGARGTDPSADAHSAVSS